MEFRSAPISIKLNDQLASATSKVVPGDVQVMRTGTFFSEEYGKFEITKQTLSDMKTNFDNRVRGIDLAIDYKHDSEDIAAGWIKDVYLLNDGNELWAKVDWTPNGEKVLSDKEFRYLSADFSFDFQHNETKEKHGPTLFGAGLTNRPFIKSMKPVVALSEKEKGKVMDEKDQKIAELEAKIAELTKQIEELNKNEQDEKVEDKKEDQAPPADASPSQPEESEQMSAMKKEMDDMKKKLEEYQAKEKQAEQDKKLSEKKGVFNKLLSEGKAVEAQREAYMSDDMVKFAENAQALNLQGIGSSVEPAAAITNEDVSTQIAKLAEAKVSEKKITFGAAVVQVLNENEGLRKKYETK
jgi:phage I-like protein